MKLCLALGAAATLAVVGCASAPVATAPEAPAAGAESYYRDLFPDTWVATDAVGRVMPGPELVGPLKDDGKTRVVGIFYIAWHTPNHMTITVPYTADVSKVLAGHPEARLDGSHPAWTAGSYHWGEPEWGYFLSQDKWVIRRDMSMLADAGVDVLVMDVTNAVRYWDEWDVIFSTMEEMRAEGNKTPQFIFWAFNGPCITVVQDLYERIYAQGRFKDLWFEWDGKPLLLYNGRPDFDATGQKPVQTHLHYIPEAVDDPTHPHHGDPKHTTPVYEDYTPEVKEFFTLRTMWWGYHQWAGERFVGTPGNWSFGYDLNHDPVYNMDPSDLISRWEGRAEQAAVTPAQHPMSLVGKSWSRATREPELNELDLPVATHVPWLGETVENPEGYGIYFQERWDEALVEDPEFLYINDWNEWTAGKYPAAEGTTFPFLRRDSNFFFVDQYNSEFNRCVQPMLGGYTDNYYMQMAQNIRRYKGARPIPQMSGLARVKVDGEFADWDAITVEHRDTIGDTIHRDHPGYGGTHYTDTSGRNDIITAKVAVGRDEIAFMAETREALTPSSDPNWMLLFIDADQDDSTGWEGHDFLVNKSLASASETTVMQWDDATGDWKEVARVPYAVAGNKLELSIPRALLGLEGDALSFDHKWADNPAELADAISLCTHGDTAPNRRFSYRVKWSSR